MDQRSSGHVTRTDPAGAPSEWAVKLAKLADAWRDDSAWSGTTHAGGQDLPGELAGVIALDEVIVHGWDIAVASGQPFACEPELAVAVLGFGRPTAGQNLRGVPGLFGPPVHVGDDAPLLDRLIGLTGRDPSWRPKDAKWPRRASTRPRSAEGPTRSARLLVHEHLARNCRGPCRVPW